jgi:hypothetical protein
MARTRKSNAVELAPQLDPRAPLDIAAFLKAAQAVLELLTKDLLARADESPEITSALKARHAHDKSQKRTAETYAVWRRELVVQIAAAWLLSCVFVRTLEDRGLLTRNRLAGPGALDAERAFAQLAPHLGPREYLLTIFCELDHFPAARRLFDREHNLAWRLAPSNEGAKALVALFRVGDADAPHFRFGQPSTRFLGDLYQDLSEDVRKRYALLQTPDFVEAYILDRTLEPAIAEFGLRYTTVIDPTCGSGHFVLGAFERLFDRWCGAEPGESDERHVELALKSVYGADINPYAVFIAEFRLTLAAIEKLGVGKLRDAPQLPINLVVADSLLHGRSKGQAGFGDLLGQEAKIWHGDEFAVEDEAEAKRVLGGGYAAVVGNPPYITVKDKALRDRYRELYSAAYREYSLSVPFMQCFFQLARKGGFVGQITANSFMKREFGKLVIEQFLPTVDLREVINTSGAFIPGHGTPTVILFGRNREPVREQKVHAVLARRGEPSTPDDPAQGWVWSAIRDHGTEVGYEDEYVTVAEVEREKLGKHPWSLEGGGAGDLKALLEARAKTVLGEVVESIGFMCITKQDDVFSQPAGTFDRWNIERQYQRSFVIGEMIRDWTLDGELTIFFPYDPLTKIRQLSQAVLRPLWPFKAILDGRAVFGGKTFREAGKYWYEYGQIPQGRTEGPCIGFAFVATHNHFVLDRGGKIFNRTAPIIKLPETATEDDHLALLAYLNSSTGCFWMKQVFFDKGNRGEGGGTTSEDWEKFFEHDGTKLGQLPLPPLTPGLRAVLIDEARLAMELATQRNTSNSWDSTFEKACDATQLTNELATLAETALDLESKIRAAQERMDWHIYSAFGLCKQSPQIPECLKPGERYSDRKFAQETIASGNARYFQLCRLPSPQAILANQPLPYADEAKTIAESNTHIALLEQPRHKRTFREGFRPEDIRRRAREWLFSKAEATFAKEAVQDSGYIYQAIKSVATETVVLTVLGLEFTQPILTELLADESVPFISVLRFTESGLEKHRVWKDVWHFQRREDMGEQVDISPPPKYSSSDFRGSDYYRLRGKLDVPKERFISYPGLESDNDNAPIYGWAGWTHSQRAEALLSLYNDRKDNEGWSTERLTPILVGIHELLPWIIQWHNEPDEATGERLGDAFRDWLSEELRSHGLTTADLDAWRPIKGGRVKKATVKKAPATKEQATTKKAATKASRKKSRSDDG